jgi:hypothetical protein
MFADAPRYPRRIVCLTEETTEALYLLGFPLFVRKMGTEALSLEAHPACIGLFQGTLAEGAECKSTLECRAPPSCPIAEERNHCQKPLALGQRC